MGIDGIIGLVLLGLSMLSVIFIYINQRKASNGESGSETSGIPTPDAKWKDASTVIAETGATSFEREISVTGDTFVSIIVEGDSNAIKVEPQSGNNLDKVKITLTENKEGVPRVFKLTVTNE